MTDTRQITNTGLLLSKSNQAALRTCFLFRYPNFLLTAAHCIEGIPDSEIVVTFPQSADSKPFQVIQIIKHDSADLAILKINGLREEEISQPLYEIVRDSRELGNEFFCYGYPMLSTQESTFRFFKGYFQRHFTFKNKQYSYSAMELNIRVPEGLSGAAVLLELGGKLCGLI